MSTQSRQLSVQTIAQLDDSQRSLLRALGYDVPEAADAAENDSADDSIISAKPFPRFALDEPNLQPPQKTGHPR